MATRGAIARLTNVLPLRWAGRYHHWDSYPDGLGRELWNLYHGTFEADLDRMLQVLLDEHPAGWSSLSSLDLEQGLANALASGDPLGASGLDCYCHGERNDEPWEVNQDNASGSGVEWAYVFTSSYALEPSDPAGKAARQDAMLVLSSYSPSGRKAVGAFGMGDPAAHWRLAAAVDLKGKEPDWNAIQEAAPPPPFPRRRTSAVGVDGHRGKVLVHRDRKALGAFVVRSVHEDPREVRRLSQPGGAHVWLCTCEDSEREEPACTHAKAVSAFLAHGREEAAARRSRGLLYSGWRASVKTEHGESREPLVLAWEAGHPRLLDPAPSQALRNHSPDGFEWGYSGSGPAQLALALLLDCTGDEEAALERYQAFKAAFLTPLGRDEAWEISSAQVEEFLTCQGRPAST